MKHERCGVWIGAWVLYMGLDWTRYSKYSMAIANGNKVQLGVPTPPTLDFPERALRSMTQAADLVHRLRLLQTVSEIQQRIRHPRPSFP